MRHISLVGLAMAVALPSAVAAAQGPGQLATALDLGALMQRDGGNQWQSATRLAPALRFAHPWAELSFDGSLLGSPNGVVLDRGTMQAALAPAPFGNFRWSAGARAERRASPAFAARTAFTGETSLSYALGSSGVWLGSAVERSPQVDSLSGRPSLRFGVWRRIGDAMVTITSSSHAIRTGATAPSLRTQVMTDSTFNDTLQRWNYFQSTRTFGDSGQRSRSQLWSDLRLGASWAHGPVAFDATFGVQQAVDIYPRALWARVSAAYQVTSAVSVVAMGGNDPARIALGIPPARVASLGIRLSSISLLRPAAEIPVRTTAAAFSLQPVGTNSYVVSVRVPSARTVELSGDFGHWQAVALAEVRPGVWETTLTLPAGTYRMNLRVDGDRWKAPPGLPTVADEFNGDVGLVVVH